jgi:hypothetical protein
MSETLCTLKHITAESLVTEPSACENEIAIKNFKKYKSPDTVQMPAEMIQSGSRRLRHEMRKLVHYFCSKKEFPHQWKESITVPIYKKVPTNYEVVELLSEKFRFFLTTLPPPPLNLMPYVRCRRNSGGSSMWTSKEKIKYFIKKINTVCQLVRSS